jgi:hypothetical protein
VGTAWTENQDGDVYHVCKEASLGIYIENWRKEVLECPGKIWDFVKIVKNIWRLFEPEVQYEQPKLYDCLFN